MRPTERCPDVTGEKKYWNSSCGVPYSKGKTVAEILVLQPMGTYPICNKAVAKLTLETNLPNFQHQ